MIYRYIICLVISTACIALMTGQAIASEPLNRSEFDASVTPLFRDFCASCHSGDEAEGDLSLDSLTLDFTDSQSAQKWIEVMDNLNLGEMPPADEPQPDVELIGKVTDWIANELRHADRASKGTGGRVLMRRLNRREYTNVVRDLLGVDFLRGEGPMEILPPDGTLDGFDNISTALLLDPSLMESYFDVARAVAEKAVVTGPPPVPTRRNRMQYEDISGGIAYIKKRRSVTVTETGLISRAHGMRSDERLRHPWTGTLIPIRGRYRLRLRVGCDPKDRDSLYIRITRRGDGDLYYGEVPGTIDQPEIIEIVRDFDTPGGDEIGVSFENAPKLETVNYHFTDLQRSSREAIAAGDEQVAGRIRSQMVAQGFPGQSRPEPSTRTIDHLPQIFFDWVELEGPLYEQWPPKSTERIFFEGLDEEKFDLEYAKRIFSRLLPRAFRRRVSSDEVDAIVSIVQSEIGQGESFPDAIKSGIIAVLCSPDFLLFVEPSKSETPRELKPLELASRLSFFLWSSIPDDELFRAAMGGELTGEAAMKRQVQRMLDDSKAEAFVDGFARQWLKVDEFDRFAIDNNLYRDFFATENAGLSEAINAEPIEFFRHLLKSGGNTLDMLDSDWTMANEPLARYYGIEGVQGRGFRRVSLPPSTHRGGLTTMAAVHKWGSDGNRTKPVERGKYILEVLFNDPPKPPPPNVGEVEPNVKGADLTVRQRLDQHRTIKACANCHRKIDPYGLALENFSVISKWRTKQDGERGWWPDEAVIDPSGQLPNGESFSSVEEFRKLLRQQDERFLRGLSEKMFTYALARTVETTDRATIDNLVDHMKRNNNSLQSLIEAITITEEFKTK